MAKVHIINRSGIPHTENQTSQNTMEQYNAVWTIAIGSAKIITKTKDIEVTNISYNKAAISNFYDETPLKIEKSKHQWKATIRMNLFKKIVSNEPVKWEVFKLFFCILISILVSSTSPFAYTLIPLHNLIICPNYWYEIPLQAIQWCLLGSIYYSHVTGCCLNVEYIKAMGPL